MSPSLELQEAITLALKGNSGVTSLIGQRVYDRVPENPVFPYVTHGPVDELSEDIDCVTGFDISLQVDVWSRKVGFGEAKAIADAVRRAIVSAVISLTDNALVGSNIEHIQTQILRDPDGLTSHGVLTFNAFVEQP